MACLGHVECHLRVGDVIDIMSVVNAPVFWRSLETCTVLWSIYIRGQSICFLNPTTTCDR
jgi:hypothetical protein